MTQCDNKSVGVVIKENGNFVVILRNNYPVSYAFVAGHLDGDAPPQAAIKEAKEEVHVNVLALKHLLSETFSNSCKRDGGKFHEWDIFEATKWRGEIRAGSDAKKVYVFSPRKISALAKRTRSFSKPLGIPLDRKHLNRFTKYVVDNPKWQKNPGLEPVWVLMLEKIGIV